MLHQCTTYDMMCSCEVMAWDRQMDGRKAKKSDIWEK